MTYLESNLFYLGVPNIYNYGITSMKMGGNYYDYKDKIKNQVSRKAKQIRKALVKRKVGFKTKFFLNYLE